MNLLLFGMNCGYIVVCFAEPSLLELAGNDTERQSSLGRVGRSCRLAAFVRRY